MEDNTSSKIFNDSVHGHIEMPPLLVKIIDTPEFQRLRNIKQLGGGYYVYPGASHNRFEHSIGVAHLAGQLVKSLKARQGLNITKQDEVCVQIAGLCHDLGHGPFSHAFEKFMKELNPHSQWKHEQQSVKIFKHLNTKHQLGLGMEDVNLIADLINSSAKEVPQHEQSAKMFEDLKKQMKNDIKDDTLTDEYFSLIADLIIPSEIPKYEQSAKMFEELKKQMKNDLKDDALTDECFSLIKDLIIPFQTDRYLYEIVANSRTGIDVDKMDYFSRDCHHLGMKCNFSHERYMKFARVCTDKNEEPQICMRDKEAINMYELFHIRNLLHHNAYQHRVVKAVELMIVDALKKAENTFKISSQVNNLQKYVTLTDDILQQIQCSESTDSDLKEAQEIIDRISERKFYKFIGAKIFEPEDLKHLGTKDQDQKTVEVWLKNVEKRLGDQSRDLENFEALDNFQKTLKTWLTKTGEMPSDLALHKKALYQYQKKLEVWLKNEKKKLKSLGLKESEALNHFQKNLKILLEKKDGGQSIIKDSYQEKLKTWLESLKYNKLSLDPKFVKAGDEFQKTMEEMPSRQSLNPELAKVVKMLETWLENEGKRQSDADYVKVVKTLVAWLKNEEKMFVGQSLNPEFIEVVDQFQKTLEAWLKNEKKPDRQSLNPELKEVVKILKTWLKNNEKTHGSQPLDTKFVNVVAWLKYVEESESLNTENFEVVPINFSYGMKEKNPIDALRFYRKNDPDTPVQLSKDEVSYLLPEKFAEIKVMVFYKGLNTAVENLTKKHIIEFWNDLKPASAVVHNPSIYMDLSDVKPDLLQRFRHSAEDIIKKFSKQGSSKIIAEKIFKTEEVKHLDNDKQRKEKVEAWLKSIQETYGYQLKFTADDFEVVKYSLPDKPDSTKVLLLYKGLPENNTEKFWEEVLKDLKDKELISALVKKTITYVNLIDGKPMAIICLLISAGHGIIEELLKQGFFIFEEKIFKAEHLKHLQSDDQWKEMLKAWFKNVQKKAVDAADFKVVSYTLPSRPDFVNVMLFCKGLHKEETEKFWTKCEIPGDQQEAPPSKRPKKTEN